MTRLEVEAYVTTLANRYGIPFEKTELDLLADTIFRLTDNDVETTPTEDMIVELKRRDIISAKEMVDLLLCYRHTIH